MATKKSLDSKPLDFESYLPHFDHHSPEYRANAHALYRHMQTQCPMAKTDSHGGYWVLTRYEDIMKVARDDDLFSSVPGITIPPSRQIPWDRPMTIPIDLDPPESRQFRALLDPLVSPKSVDEIEPFVRGIAAELVDNVIEAGTCDFSNDLGTPLISRVTMKMVGLPEEDWQIYSDPIQENINGDRDPALVGAGYQAAMARLAAEVVKQRTHPVEGGAIAHLIGCELDGRPLADWEITACAWLFIVGGVDTTQAGMGRTVVHLARNPKDKQRLIDQPEIMVEAIEEFLRRYTPQTALARRATRDTELNGQEIKKGDRLLMIWAAANIDPAEFENPDAIDFDRANKRHMSFGVGSHRCMGSNVARLEIRAILEEILKRMPDYTVDEERLTLAPDIGVVHAYKTLPMIFTPGKKAGS